MVKPFVPYEQLAPFADLFIGRRDDFAWQRSDGRYRRAGSRVNLLDLGDHLAGRHTMGTYVIDEHGCCSFAVYDADGVYGLPLLAQVQLRLAESGIVSYLEQSRRGGHLWVFLSEPLLARLVRAWLLPFAPAEVEFFPKQDESRGVGSLIRVPLGAHRLTDRRYPFVTWQDGKAVPYTQTLVDMVTYCLTHFQRVPVLNQKDQVALFMQPAHNESHRQPPTHTSLTKNVRTEPTSGYRTIADWCAAQEPFSLIGRYIVLDRRGMGHCPFTEQHRNGYDRRPSFSVYAPARAGGCCWHCYACNLTGNVFNFLERYHGLSARELWRRIQVGEVF
jgi:CHC2 zinc finger